MPHFEFRLKTLLALRHNERDQRRAQLAAAFDVERQIAERRRSLEAELERQRRWVRAGTSPGTIAVEKLRTAGQYETSLRAQLEQAVANHQTAAAEVGHGQQALAAAEGEVRMLEKLRERQHDEFRRAQALAEVKQLDDVAAGMRRRSSRAG